MINRGLAIFSMGSWVIVLDRIQVVSSFLSRLQKLLHKIYNWSKFATSRETYPVVLLSHCEEPSQLCFQPINVSVSNCLYVFEIICQYIHPIHCTEPSGPDKKYSLLSVWSKLAHTQILFWTKQDQSDFRLIIPNETANDLS